MKTKHKIEKLIGRQKAFDSMSEATKKSMTRPGSEKK